MNTLDGIIANNNIMVVKDGLEQMSYKLLKQPNPNKPLLKQIESDTERLDSLYLYVAKLKESDFINQKRNKYLESILISNTAYTKDLKNKVKDLEKQLSDLKENLEI